MGSRYDGVCLRQPGIGRSHGPVRPSCLGRARGNRVAEARGKAAAGWPERRAGTKRPSAGRWPETRSPLARGGAIVHRPPSVAASPEGFPACGPGSSTASGGAGLVRRLVVREHRSPGRIAGGIAVERPGLMVFASAIYRAINERRLDPPGLTRARRGIRARLRHKGKRRRGRGGPEERRGEIPGARRGGQRPEIVGERSGLGGRGGDAVVGKGAGACLVTLVGRRSGLPSGGRCAAHARRDVADVGIGVLRRHPESRTVTLDRGMGFADFEKVVQATGAVFCFALPRHPWRRGGNGNTDVLIRECFPKGAGFTAVGEQEVRAVYDAIDHRPRKRHGYRTPWEIRHSTVLHLL